MILSFGQGHWKWAGKAQSNTIMQTLALNKHFYSFWEKCNSKVLSTPG